MIAAPQLAGDGADTSHAAHRRLTLVEDLAAALGQHHALGQALEDEKAQLRLERGDQAADRRLAQPEMGGRADHGSRLADGKCGAQLQEIQGAIVDGHVMRLMHELIRTYHFSA